MSDKFKQFRDILAANADGLLETAKAVFITDANVEDLWNIYQDSFPEGENPIFRERREHDCSACHTFFRRFANAVVVTEDYNIQSFWRLTDVPYPYQQVADALAEKVETSIIVDVYCNVYGGKTAGIPNNIEFSNHDNYAVAIAWEHLYVKIPKKFKKNWKCVDYKTNIRNNFASLKSATENITIDGIKSVLDMMAEGVVYRGAEFKRTVKGFLKIMEKYKQVDSSVANNFLWKAATEYPTTILRINGSAIGQLIKDMSDGTPVDQAISKWENIMAPYNYQRPQSVVTAFSLKKAKEKIEELGLIDSIPRRFARMGDVSVRDVLFADRSVRPHMFGGAKSGDPFAMLEEEIRENPEKYKRVDAITADALVKMIADGEVQSLEVLFERRLVKNLVSLIVPVNIEAKPLFKWNNGFSWAYKGNLAASDMRELVKAAGGNVDGVLRFSIMWNDEVNGANMSDLDAHAVQPNGDLIYFGENDHSAITSGRLDVDIINPVRNKSAVENIVWTNIHKMPEGNYLLRVHNYTERRPNNGFSAEVEFDGKIYKYKINEPLKKSRYKNIAKVALNKGKFTIEHLAEQVDDYTHTAGGEKADGEEWKLRFNRFHPVSLFALSPNYWGDNKIGNMQYMFFIPGTENPEQPSGFFNEYLLPELKPHRKVLEALSDKMRVADDDNQLSGLGFDSTRRESVIVRINRKPMKLVF